MLSGRGLGHPTLCGILSCFYGLPPVTHTYRETFKVNRNLVKYLLSPVCEQLGAEIYFQKPVASANHLLLIIPHSSKLWVLQMTYRVCGATQGCYFTANFTKGQPSL